MSRTTSVPRLPGELTDIIVDFLHDDEESLANCSLVCKEWLPAARHHIVGELLLHPWNVEVFVNLITDPSATVNLVPHIHRLAIDQITMRHADLFYEMYPRLHGFDFVRRLELQNIGCNSYEWLTIDGFITALKNVTDLRLDSLVFDSPTVSWYLVVQFPLLQRLSVTNLTFSTNLSHLPSGFDFSDVVPDLRPPSIRHLVLSETDEQQTRIPEWFSSRSTLVESLSVALGSLALPSLNQYLQVLGESLLFLQIDVHFDLAGEFLSQVDLSFNTHLRKLRLCNFSFRSRHTLSDTIPSIFAKTTSSHLSEIEFVYGPPEGHDFLLELENNAVSTVTGSSIWTALDDVLSGFNSLRTIRLMLNPQQSDLASFVDHVKRGLSTCNARGLLSFERVIDELPPRFLRLPSRHGMISGPLCITQLEEPTAAVHTAQGSGPVPDTTDSSRCRIDHLQEDTQTAWLKAAELSRRWIIWIDHFWEDTRARILGWITSRVRYILTWQGTFRSDSSCLVA